MTRQEAWEAYENQKDVKAVVDGETIIGKITTMLSNKTTRYDCRFAVGKKGYYAKASGLEVVK